MKMFFDFDDFFLDTANALAKDFFRALSKETGVDEGIVWEVYREFSLTVSGGAWIYTPERHLQRISDHKKFDRDAVRQSLKERFSDIRRYVFPDAIPFLKMFSREDMFLLTYGDDAYQRQKVRSSGLQEYFSDIFVVRSDKIDEIQKRREALRISPKEKVVFADNSCSFFNGEHSGITTIHLKRQSDEKAQANCGYCDYQAENLKKVADIIQSLMR